MINERVWILGAADPDLGWRQTTIEYRLVRRHFLGYVEVNPLGLTKRQGGNNQPPWHDDPRVTLPFRDGAHARHDAAHLGQSRRDPGAK